MNRPVDVAERLSLFSDHGAPKVVARDAGGDLTADHGTSLLDHPGDS